MNTTPAIDAIESFLRTYRGIGGLGAIQQRVRASGDDADVIKVWVDLGSAAADQDLAPWMAACATAIQKAVAEAAEFRIQVRAEAGA